MSCRPTHATATSPPPRSVSRYEDERFRMGFARTVTHYFGNDRFLGEGHDEGVVLRDAPLLVLVDDVGRYAGHRPSPRLWWRRRTGTHAPG